jgi:hypothetical protein
MHKVRIYRIIRRQLLQALVPLSSTVSGLFSLRQRKIKVRGLELGVDEGYKATTSVQHSITQLLYLRTRMAFQGVWTLDSGLWRLEFELPEVINMGRAIDPQYGVFIVSTDLCRL